MFYFTDMDTMWEYNAPQYVDFTKRMEDDRADAYFGAFALVRLFASNWQRTMLYTGPTVCISK